MLSGSTMSVETSRITPAPFLQSDTMSFPTLPKTTAITLKLTERSGNVYENKGPLWRIWEPSWNLHENKGDT
jgi:hypothetical protein